MAPVGERICAWCQHRNLSDVYYVFSSTIVRCDACSLMQTYPIPTLDALAGVYSERYFSNVELINPHSEAIYGYSDYMAERLTKQAKYRRILQKVQRFLQRGGVASRDLLDIGCGYGFFLDSAVDFGFTPYGVEFNKHAIATLSRRYAFPVFHSETSVAAGFRPNSFACVAMLDTIEHLLDPFTTLDEIHQLLLPNGIVAVSTMDSTSLVSRLLGARLEDFRRIREHLFFFDRRTMRTILEKKGFEVLDVNSIGHTFELGSLVARIGASFPVLRRLQTVVSAAHADHLKVSLNPRTKMIFYARRV
jgi:2-polyprenyl-3-methyl-5-hydroxy-6-metoxy-1,4-benzoquinol methylase